MDCCKTLGQSLDVYAFACMYTDPARPTRRDKLTPMAWPTWREHACKWHMKSMIPMHMHVGSQHHLWSTALDGYAQQTHEIMLVLLPITVYNTKAGVPFIAIFVHTFICMPLNCMPLRFAFQGKPSAVLVFDACILM